jgi:selenide, water dikinase
MIHLAHRIAAAISFVALILLPQLDSLPMQSPEIFVKDLVLVGGGHAHVHTIKMLGMKGLRGVAVTLITRDVDSPYSGMIPGFVAGHYVREECHVDLAKLCSFAGVNMIHAEACKLDVKRNLIYCRDGRPPIHYDVLSIDVGIAPKPLPQEFKETVSNITPVKPIDGFAARWDFILARVLAADNDASIRLAVVGGGAGGVELCFAIQYRLHKDMIDRGKDPSKLRISIYNRGKTLMSSHNRSDKMIPRIAFSN